ERLHGCVIAQHEIEYARQKPRVGGGLAQGVRANSRLGQERTQPFRVARYEAQRLNRNNFSDFPGDLNRLCQSPLCLSVNLWSLICKRYCPSLPALFKQVETTMRKKESGLTG